LKILQFLRATAYTCMLWRVYAITRPSDRPSHGCIIEKRLKVLWLWNFHHTVAPSL